MKSQIPGGFISGCLVSAALAAAILFSACTPDAPGQNWESYGNADFMLEAALPEEIETITSYRIVPPDVTTASVAELGSKLGFTGKAGFIHNDKAVGMLKPDKREFLEVKANSGAIRYTRPSKLFPLSLNLPDDKKAVAIATEFLDRIGLLYPDMTAQTPVIGGTYQTEPSHLLVRFTRTVDGIPMTGIGNKLAVRIGDGGEVVEFVVHHPEFVPDHGVRCIGAEQAFDKLKAGESDFDIPMNCKEIVIEEAYLGYYLEPIGEKQELVMPVYVFKGQYLDKKDAALPGEFYSYVDAVEK